MLVHLAPLSSWADTAALAALAHSAMSPPAPARPAPSDALLVKHHVLFALRNARYLPTPYQADDTSRSVPPLPRLCPPTQTHSPCPARMTLAYFCLASLALLPSAPVSSHDPHLSALDVMLKPAQRQGFLDWVYEQQLPQGGFRGSDSLAPAAADSARPSSDLDPANLIQTYTALVILGLLDDDYARLRPHDLARFVGACQNPDGSCVSPPPGRRDESDRVTDDVPLAQQVLAVPGLCRAGRSSLDLFGVRRRVDARRLEHRQRRLGARIPQQLSGASVPPPALEGDSRLTHVLARSGTRAGSASDQVSRPMVRFSSLPLPPLP